MSERRGKTLSAAGLIDKQQEEQAEFLSEMARKLNVASYDWNVQDRYTRPHDDVVYKGLIISTDGRLGRATILTPQGTVLMLEKGRGLLMRCTPDQILKASGKGFLQDVENAVATVLTSLQGEEAVWDNISSTP